MACKLYPRKPRQKRSKPNTREKKMQGATIIVFVSHYYYSCWDTEKNAKSAGAERSNIPQCTLDAHNVVLLFFFLFHILVASLAHSLFIV